MHKPPLIVVDLGTATVFDVVSRDGDYLGGAIAPGIGLATDALVQRAAMLRRGGLPPPKSGNCNKKAAGVQAGRNFCNVRPGGGLLWRGQAGGGEEGLGVGPQWEKS